MRSQLREDFKADVDMLTYRLAVCFAGIMTHYLEFGLYSRGPVARFSFHGFTIIVLRRALALTPTSLTHGVVRAHRVGATIVGTVVVIFHLYLCLGLILFRNCHTWDVLPWNPKVFRPEEWIVSVFMCPGFITHGLLGMCALCV